MKLWQYLKHAWDNEEYSFTAGVLLLLAILVVLFVFGSLVLLFLLYPVLFYIPLGVLIWLLIQEYKDWSDKQ